MPNVLQGSERDGKGRDAAWEGCGLRFCDNLVTVAFTLDVYGHVTEQMQIDSADRMQRYLQSL